MKNTHYQVPAYNTFIANNAFINNQNVKKLTISYGTLQIGDYAFSHCKQLEFVELPETLEKIGIGAFSCCSALKAITIPDKIREIERETFQNCESLNQVIIEGCIESIGENAFSYCISLESIKIPCKVKRIECDAFYSCKRLESILIPDSVEYIGANAFSNCNLDFFSLGKGIKKVDFRAFENLQCEKFMVCRETLIKISNEISCYPNLIKALQIREE